MWKILYNYRIYEKKQYKKIKIMDWIQWLHERNELIVMI